MAKIGWIVVHIGTRRRGVPSRYNRVHDIAAISRAADIAGFTQHMKC